MGGSFYNLPKRLTTAGMLGCMAVGWLLSAAQTSTPLLSSAETAVSGGSFSLRLAPGEPTAGAYERHVQLASKDARRPTVFGLTTSSLSLGIRDGRQYSSFVSVAIL